VFRLATFLPRLGNALVLLASVLATACSVLVDKNIAQCERDSDCKVAPFSSCSGSVCVDPKASGNCVDPSGCFRCEPHSNAEHLNACSDSTCVPFDNESRLLERAADGKLRPLLR
jgi:hypothetical protein